MRNVVWIFSTFLSARIGIEECASLNRSVPSRYHWHTMMTHADCQWTDTSNHADSTTRDPVTTKGILAAGCECATSYVIPCGLMMEHPDCACHSDGNVGLLVGTVTTENVHTYIQLMISIHRQRSTTQKIAKHYTRGSSRNIITEYKIWNQDDGTSVREGTRNC